MQIVAYLPDAQGQGPIIPVNDVEQSMYKYMNNIRNETQLLVQIQAPVSLLVRLTNRFASVLQNS